MGVEKMDLHLCKTIERSKFVDIRNFLEHCQCAKHSLDMVKADFRLVRFVQATRCFQEYNFWSVHVFSL